MPSLHTLFWKVFVITFVSTSCVFLASYLFLRIGFVNQLEEVRQSEQYQQLTDYVISRYEEGYDTADLRERPRRRRDGPPIRVVDKATGTVLLSGGRGINPPRNPEFWKGWDFVADSGAVYEVAVNVARLPKSRPPALEANQIVVGVGIIALFSWLITMSITGPIKRLQEHVKTLGVGDLDHKLDSSILRRKDEIGDLAVEVDSMAARIRELIESKQRLFYDVSHELRAPLARMCAMNEIASMRAQKAGESPEMHDRFNREIESLNQLITELMEYAKNDKSVLPLENVSVAKLVTQVIDDMGFSERDTRLTLDVDVAENEMTRMRPALLARALKNIVENALKYAPPDTSISTRLCVEEDQYVITVRDQGSGIPEDQLSTVLQPFTRLHGESVEGVGLGLSIAHRAMQDLGGNLTLSNHEEGGLLVRFFFPARLAENHTQVTSG